MKKYKSFLNNLIIKNTIILIICTFLMKCFGLINRVLLTRLLGTEGISLYILSLPTIMLFMNIAGLSLNISVTKIVSENEITKKYSTSNIINNSFFLGLFSCLFATIILISIINPLSKTWLKQENIKIPILTILIFLPFVSGNNVFRGFFNGINKLNISAYSGLIESIFRIISIITLLSLKKSDNLVLNVSFAIISMGIGEVISFLYLLFLYTKESKIYKNSESSKKQILSLALVTTITKIISSITMFLEPIIYTFSLSKIGFSSEKIIFKYSEVNAYALPLITMFSFISTSISTSLIPNITKSFVKKDIKKVNILINKALLFSLLPGILISFILYNYSSELMKIIYGVTIGSEYVKQYVFIFLVFYLEPPLVSILQAIGKSKNFMYITIITNIIKLTLILILPFINIFKENSLIISIALNIIILTLILLIYLKKVINYKVDLNIILKLTFLTFLMIVSFKIIKASINSFILASVISTLIFVITVKNLKFIDF